MTEIATIEATFDVLIVGGGHAGVEAAIAAARMGARVAFSRVSSAQDPQVHDPLRLAVSIGEAMTH